MRVCWEFLAAVAAVVIVPSASHTQDRQLPKTGDRPQKPYASPSDVFDAYRQAFERKDARAELSCWVPEIREDAGRYFAITGIAYAMAPDEFDPKTRAVLKKLGADKVVAEYVKQFKAKYGYDPVKFQIDYEAKVKQIKAGLANPNELGQWREVLDEGMLRTIANQLFTDKFAVVLALDDFQSYAGTTRYGPLKNVRTLPDGATGVAVETTRAEVRDSGGPGPGRQVNAASASETQFWFRKTKDGWLISGGPRGVSEPPKLPAPGWPPTPAPAP
jgi:hypothetical protein